MSGEQPVTAYDPAQWTDLFVASAGASAPLAGLIFVAVSINIERILNFEGLPERALEALVVLVSVVLVSIGALIPGQSHTALGIELLVFGLALAFVLTKLSVPPPGGSEPQLRVVARRVSRAAWTLPLIIGGASLILQTGGGLYWTVAGMLFAIASGVGNAWVFLVEILR